MSDDRVPLARNVLALGLMTLGYAAYQGICQTIVPLAMDHHGFTKTTIGLMQAVPGIIVLSLGAPFARLANGRWRRATLTSCFVMAGIGSVLYSTASRPLEFVAPQLLFGLSSTAFWCNMVSSSLRLSRTPYKIHRIQAIVTSLQGIGAFGGPLLGGYLSIHSFPLGFLAGVPCAAIGLGASRLLSRSIAIESTVGAREFVVGAYAQLFRLVTGRPIVLVGMSFVMLNCFLLYVMGGSFFAVYASQIGLSVFVAAALISGREAISAVARLGFSRLSRYQSPIVVLSAGTVVGAFSLALLPLATALFGVALVALAQGICLAFLPPAVNSLVGASTAPHEQSYAIVGMHSGNFIAQTIMSPFLGLMLYNFGYSVVYPAVGGVWIVLALLATRAGLRFVRQDRVGEPPRRQQRQGDAQ
ncbi:MAG: MFS transporter [Gemmatimonadetes bacterium]|jgi:MFS family permease|nr:MFS transporter [Gemmatimonadota bacterium]MBT7862417.1 MFS transporter [Gemmatimonadota bacterium]